MLFHILGTPAMPPACSYQFPSESAEHVYRQAQGDVFFVSPAIFVCKRLKHLFRCVKLSDQSVFILQGVPSL